MHAVEQLPMGGDCRSEGGSGEGAPRGEVVGLMLLHPSLPDEEGLLEAGFINVHQDLVMQVNA